MAAGGREEERELRLSTLASVSFAVPGHVPAGKRRPCAAEIDLGRVSCRPLNVAHSPPAAGAAADLDAHLRRDAVAEIRGPIDACVAARPGGMGRE